MDEDELKRLGCFRLKPSHITYNHLSSRNLSPNQTDIIVRDLLEYTMASCYFGNHDHDVNNGDFTSGLYISHILNPVSMNSGSKQPLPDYVVTQIAEQLKSQENLIGIFDFNRSPFWWSAWAHLLTQPNLSIDNISGYLTWFLDAMQRHGVILSHINFEPNEILEYLVSRNNLSMEALMRLSGHNSELVRAAAVRNPSCPIEGRIMETLYRVKLV